MAKGFRPSAQSLRPSFTLHSSCSAQRPRPRFYLCALNQTFGLLRPWFSLWLSPCPPWPPSQLPGTWTETSVQRVCFFMSCLYPCLSGLSRAPAASAALFSLISYIFGILGASLKSHDICESHFSLKKEQGSWCQVSEKLGLMNLK